jgi:pSer/pThr/pTyr-binding forkhead associated (FHA) protein
VASPAPKPVTFAATVLDSEVDLEEARPSTQPELVEAYLVHKATGQRFDIPNEETVYVGKPNDEIAIQVDLSILPESDIISRVHAVIHHEGENYYLEDAGSMNGTSLNQEAVRPGTRFRKLMQNGDIITFGRKRQVSFVFERR